MIENTFGILASQQRILTLSNNVIKMVLTRACLYNWLKTHDLDGGDYLITEIDSDCENWERVPGTWRSENGRDDFCEYFNLEEALPWEFLYIYNLNV